LDALQRARRVRAMDGAHQRREDRKEKQSSKNFKLIGIFRISLRTLR
jgi:hypothetical protein